MKPFEDIFLKQLPTIDLHGLDRDTARVYVNDFVDENMRLGKKEIVIVHGIGEGILKKQVHETLKQNKYVVSYKLHTYNTGCTIVTLGGTYGK